MATILVVDDRPINRQFLVTLLGYGGHRILEAADGAEALVVVSDQHPDLVITDIVMPTMDGYEFVTQLRQDPTISQTKVVFYTAIYRTREANALAKACGVEYVIGKPSEPQVILETITRVLGVETPPTALPAPSLIAEPEPTHLNALGHKLTASLNETKAVQAKLNALIQGGMDSSAERDRLQEISDGLTRPLTALQTLGLRLTALIELNLDLASERDPLHLLELFCHAAQNITSARYAGLGILDESRKNLRVHMTAGLDSVTQGRISTPRPFYGVLGQVLVERKPRRFKNLNGDPQNVGLPAEYPPVHSFLCLPIITGAQTYGWLYLVDKLGDAEFGVDDEQIGMTLAAQVALAYENVRLYNEIQRHVTDLQTEIAERQRAEKEIRTLNTELEDRVRQRTAQLEEANKELQAFSYSVSHDLRAPLRAISNYSADVLEDHATALTSDGRKELEVIHAEAKRMEELIDGLLSFSQLSQQEMTLSPIDMTALVHSSMNDLRFAMENRVVEFQVAELPPAQGDPMLIRQVWVNLLSNALKFTRGKNPAIIQVGARVDERQTTFFVKDNGVGFDRRYRNKLFGVFQRLVSSEEFEGTGIGLSLVRRIVHRHGGQVSAEGELGKGATFYFSLPNSRPSSATAGGMT